VSQPSLTNQISNTAQEKLTKTDEWRRELYYTRGWTFRVGGSFRHFPIAISAFAHWPRRQLFQGFVCGKQTQPVAELQLPDRRGYYDERWSAPIDSNGNFSPDRLNLIDQHYPVSIILITTEPRKSISHE